MKLHKQKTGKSIVIPKGHELHQMVKHNFEESPKHYKAE